jgi:hypothetical protein
MNISLWRDISVVLLALEAFILALIPLAVVYFANKGLWRLRASVRPLFRQVREYVQQVEMTTTRVAEMVVAPIMSFYALVARVRGTILTVVGLMWGGIRR